MDDPVKNLRVEKITAAEAAAWAAGERLRIVMLGDSICNDTSNSLYETLLAERYPGARIEVVTNVRGGTGCQYYKDENRVQEYVLDDRPDLVIIAGISHGYDVDAIRSVVRQIRAGSDCEVLVMTGAISRRDVIEPAFLKSRPAGVALDMIERFPGELAALCREEGVEFFDMRRVWDAYVQESYRPLEHFLRDPIHGNSRGKAVLARILGRYFAPK